MTLASTLRRPRWGMPITISSTPSSAERRMIASSAGSALSPPSRPKRLVPGNLTCRKRSKPSAITSCSRISFFSSAPGREQVVRAFHALLDPGLLLRILDVHELDADLGRVGLAQDLDDPAERRLLEAEHVVEEELALEIGVGEAVGLGVELGMLLVAGEAERVEVGQQMAAHPIGADQHDHAQMVDDQAPGALAAEVDDLAAVAPAAPRAGRSRRGGAGARSGCARTGSGSRVRARRNSRASSGRPRSGRSDSGRRGPR